MILTADLQQLQIGDNLQGDFGVILMNQPLAGFFAGRVIDGIDVLIDIVERPRGDLAAVFSVRRTHIDSELCAGIDRHHIGGAVRRGAHINCNRLNGGEISRIAVAERPNRSIGQIMVLLNVQTADRGIVDLRRDAETLELVGIHTLEYTAPVGRLSGVLARYDLVVLKRVEGNQL